MNAPLQTTASLMTLAPSPQSLKSLFVGCGYDITDRFCHPSSVKARLVDMDRFIKQEPHRFRYVEATSSDSKMVAAANAEEYCTSLTAKLDASLKIGGFGGSLSCKFNYDQSCSSKYSFGSFFLIMREAHTSLGASAADLQKYLLQETFLSDLQNRPLEDIIQIYGTHLITSSILGGRLEVLCRSISQSKTKSESIEAGIKASYKKIASGSADVSYNEKKLQENSELTVTIETVGGDPTKSIIKVFDYSPSINFTSDFDAWQKGLNSSNMTLVDMEKNSLIPLDKLVPDTPEYSTKKKELKEAIARYLQENRFKMIDAPKHFYHYVNRASQKHFYTMNRDELGNGKWDYYLEGNACDILDVQLPHTIPLHRYYHAKNDAHFYTTNWNELYNGKDGWAYEGVAGFVYPKGDFDPKLIPLYRYFHAAKLGHFYSTTTIPSESGWNKEGIAGFVFPPSPVIFS
ncbi:MAG: membrane attack complex protein/perforin/complement C9 [Wolinella succinogenes]|uniref:MAC/perforin domain-containing protein n=1 Tax=Wolinella succinogenes TaxID=844 RepID=UPI00169672AD|nr:MAC/perforin domain-containing protein [Wolinella succinogenes]NLU34202.1 membrane attack complex protein/perforin/complement C9 [Wolinella succinogenes]